MNGRLNVEQILAMSYLPNFETLRILFGLLSAGVLERGGPVESERHGIELEYELQEIVEHYNRSFEAVCASLRAKVDDDEATTFTDQVLGEVRNSFRCSSRTSSSAPPVGSTSISFSRTSATSPTRRKRRFWWTD